MNSILFNAMQVHLKTVQCLTLIKCDICNVAVASQQLKRHKMKKHKVEMMGMAQSDWIPAWEGQQENAGNKNPLPWSDMEKGLVPCEQCPALLGLSTKEGRKKKMQHFKV